MTKDKQEIIKLLKWLPNETKIYEINEREVKLAGGITLDVHSCVDNDGNSTFRQPIVNEIENVGELLCFIERPWYMHSKCMRIRDYTPLSIINSYIGKIANLPMPEEALIFWQWGQTMNKDELQKAIEFTKKMRREDEKIVQEKNLLNDSDDIDTLEQQIDTLERALQSNKSETKYLEWKIEKIGKEKFFYIFEPEVKEMEFKKSEREWEIIKLERKINEKQRKINFLKRKKISLLSMVQGKEFEKIKNSADGRLEADSQKSFLDMLLKVQEQLVFLENSPQSLRAPSERQLEKAKKVLSEKLTNEEIINFCQLQKEITSLEIKLESLQEAQIEINEL